MSKDEKVSAETYSQDIAITLLMTTISDVMKAGHIVAMGNNSTGQGVICLPWAKVSGERLVVAEDEVGE